MYLILEEKGLETFIKCTAEVIYCVSPTDLLRDRILVASFIDEVVVTVFVLAHVCADLAKLTKRENQHA